MLLETYLFINPLCKQCIQSEKTVLKLANTLECKFSFQFVPMLNINIIHDNTKRLRKNAKLQLSTEQSYKIHYELVLDFKAASFQGKKRGRKFLMMLQNEIVNLNQPYSDELILKIAKKARLDLEMFKEDRKSTLAKNAFKSDQKLTNEMKITQPSSAVIFDCNSSNYGVLINEINYQCLLNICQRDLNNKNYYHSSKTIRTNFHCI